MSVPRLGFVFDDNAKALRLISGVPGAAQMDLSVSIEGTTLSSAFVHSRDRLALTTLKSGAIALVDWNATPRITNLDTNLKLQAVAFSRSGNRVAFTDGMSVEVWSDLRGNPERTAQFSVDAEVRGLALALNDDGLLAVSGAGGIVLFDGQQLDGQRRRTILTGIDTSVLAFFANGQDLLAASGASVHLIRDIRKSSGSASVIVLDQDVSALSVSNDGAWAAASTKTDVALVNLSDNSVSQLRCACKAASFDALEGNFVVTAIDSRGSLVVLDLGSAPKLTPIPEFGGATE